MSASSSASFRVAARLGTATTLTLFGLIVIGSVVRTTGSGLACPDWPLCHGRWLPLANANVFIEWFHRLIALIASLLLFATVAWTVARGEVRRRLGALAGLATLFLAVQVLLGALTVWKLLHPSVVSSHLAVALLLFSTLVLYTLTARAEASPATLPAAPRPAGVLPALGAITALCFAQAVLGWIVSTSHAGLACPDWPTCNGRWLPPLEGLVGLQMLHRGTAYLLALATIALAAVTRRAADPGLRAGGAAVLGLTLLQVVIGVANVLLGLPVWVSALHLANAAAILALLVTLTFRAALMPARAGALAAVPAR